MEENTIYDGNLDELEVVSEVTGESLEPTQPTNSEPSEVVVIEDDSTSDVVGKLIFAAGATVVGAGAAYVIKNRKKIKKNCAEKAKAKAEKKLAKQAAKIKKANDILQELEEQKEISEECETITATTTE
ncbi:MAG: hypothetical protein J6Y02_12960 [Pseudobutyrivibrio sp.]|nr:hypothetical protein [Pseudobutyrivibrio sp.]